MLTDIEKKPIAGALEERYYNVLNENSLLKRRLAETEYEVNRMKQTAQLVGHVEEVLDKKAIIRTGTGLVIANEPPDNELKIGDRVTLHNNLLSIIDILPSAKDPLVNAMELIEKPELSYQEIGGLKEQIQDVREVVELPLTKPDLFKKVGITPPKGVLFIGPPGTGKTLLAKAVANESNACFIHVIASELVNKFIGEGARLVKEMFQLAKEKSPSIIFIDEVDAIAARRLDVGTGADREVQRTLIQFLAELDGFDARGEVVIVAATNRPDILDDALLRPGRIDRLIEFPIPTFKDREAIFKVHCRGINLGKVSFKKLAKETDGASGADIQAIVTEAGLFAIREDKEKVEETHFMQAIEKILTEEEEQPVMFG